MGGDDFHLVLEYFLFNYCSFLWLVLADLKSFNLVVFLIAAVVALILVYAVAAVLSVYFLWRFLLVLD